MGAKANIRLGPTATGMVITLLQKEMTHDKKTASIWIPTSVQTPICCESFDSALKPLTIQGRLSHQLFFYTLTAMPRSAFQT
jgi:hypothetical protein